MCEQPELTVLEYTSPSRVVHKFVWMGYEPPSGQKVESRIFQLFLTLLFAWSGSAVGPELAVDVDQFASQQVVQVIHPAASLLSMY